jgi:hypothetical protein
MRTYANGLALYVNADSILPLTRLRIDAVGS